jgi:CMP-N-acetylneuraminic acid synthetase
MNYLINIESNDIVEYDQDYDTLSKNLRTEPWRQATAQEAKPYLVEKHIRRIKEEAAKCINNQYPIWKQSNIQGQAIDILCREQKQKAIDPSYSISEQDKAVLREAKRIKSSIAYLQEKSNTLEASLSQLSLEELETFNCADESHWA